MLERMRVGWCLTLQSLDLLKERPQLMLLPLMSGLAMLAVMGSLFVPLRAYLPEETGSQDIPAQAMVLVFLGYLVVHFIGVYFQSALVACVYRQSRGFDHSLSDGLAAANSRLGTLLLWSVINASVGMIIKTLQQRTGEIGHFILGLIGVAWNIATYFVVPVLVVEGLGPRDALTRSAGLFKKTWGETATSNASLGLFYLIGFFAALGLAFLGAMMHQSPVLSGVFLLLGLGGMALVVVAYFAMEGIINTVLYLHGTERQTPVCFDDALLADAFCARQG